MTFFINQTGTIAQILQSGTETMTGSLMATLFFVLLFLLILCFMFQIPIEFAAIILLPFCITTAAYYSDFLKPLVVFLIYLAMVISKHWLFR